MKNLPLYFKTLKAPAVTFTLAVDHNGESYIKLKLADGRKAKIPTSLDQLFEMATVFETVRHGLSRKVTANFGSVIFKGACGTEYGCLDVFSERFDGEVLLVAKFYHSKADNIFALEMVLEEANELANMCRDVISTLQASKAA